jgi:putative ABC transport system permease protein
MKPGVSLAQAQAELLTIKPDVSGTRAEFFKNIGPFLQPVRETYQNNEARMFWVFVSVAGFLYAIACTNAANLMLARTIDRQRELAVRLALGGTRWQIMRLVLSESVLLTTMASAAGALIAQWGYWAFNSLLSGGRFTGGAVLADVPIIVTFVALVALAAVVTAIVSALRIAHSNLSETMKAGAGTLGESRRLRRLRSGFVIMQSALAVILLAGRG